MYYSWEKREFCDQDKDGDRTFLSIEGRDIDWRAFQIAVTKKKIS
ncbi:hypothetical protein PAHA111176_00265 [Parendozoicomonas haliclonae]|uniref:Uncharacterized protein n=1 Tax=Parendozoicomonas haliclonae TaxID=1960125 RepID=A0A1X7AGI1_9GAMM|nr:hypothetical protein EHSB41UT_00858 [Parendozoicomonas haliclonae]